MMTNGDDVRLPLGERLWNSRRLLPVTDTYVGGKLVYDAALWEEAGR